MPAPVTIRPAAVADLPAIVKMGCEFLETTSYKAIATPDPERIFDLIAGMMLNPNNIVLVADKDGVAVGLIAMYIVPNHVTGTLMAGEVVWWVNPDARGCGSKLLAAAEQWAKDQATPLTPVASHLPSVDDLVIAKRESRKLPIGPTAHRDQAPPIADILASPLNAPIVPCGAET